MNNDFELAIAKRMTPKTCFSEQVRLYNLMRSKGRFISPEVLSLLDLLTT